MIFANRKHLTAPNIVWFDGICRINPSVCGSVRNEREWSVRLINSDFSIRSVHQFNLVRHIIRPVTIARLLNTENLPYRPYQRHLKSLSLLFCKCHDLYLWLREYSFLALPFFHATYQELSIPTLYRSSYLCTAGHSVGGLRRHHPGVPTELEPRRTQHIRQGEVRASVAGVVLFRGEVGVPVWA